MPKLKSGGTLVICAPCDKASFPAMVNDPDLHLFSWSANNIANLAKAVGFEIVESREWVHRLPPKWKTLKRFLPAKIFEVTCVLTALLDRRRSQVRLIARRP